MKRLMIALTVLFAFSSSAFAQMGNSQGGGMMRGDSGIEVGNGIRLWLRMDLDDHYHDSPSFWHCLYDEAETKIWKQEMTQE